MWFWDWSTWIWNSFHSISSEGKALIVAVVGAGIKWWMDSRFIRQLRQEIARKEAVLEDKQKRLDAAELNLQTAQAKLDELKRSLHGSELGIWTSFGRKPPFEDYDVRVRRRNPVILTVANNKGGVGKTTVVGNLAAYFDRKKGLKVLTIDMDYQGSLSTLLRAERDQSVDRRSSVNELLELGSSPETLLTAAQKLGARLSRSELVQAFYELALFEDRLMVEWLLRENDGDDVRYRLANVLLQHPTIGKRYDLVLIDVPPRLSTATINALCSSTHLLVPTVFTPIAAETVENFLVAANGLMSGLNPNLQFVGVLETMAPPRGVNGPARSEGRRVVQEGLSRSFPHISILNNCVPQAVSIARSGVAYLNDARARRHFDAVGDEVATRLGL